ncbi:hypothetical protein LIER_08755 [Lithospermum erythrorhizon]|uniref:PSII 6.1 kDa protein n=1 Tax=Lithospermum erythrorhizon TaxID=34254 RepID=A0AAV3PEG9_LITER
MATITTCTSNISLAHALVHKGWTAPSSTSIVGFPAMSPRMGKARCSMNEKAQEINESKLGMGALSYMMVSAYAATLSNPAMALVDERMSTEGTGLPFGLSNNLLGWILFGVFGLIWSLFFIYTGSLEEDEDSGLSL